MSIRFSLTAFAIRTWSRYTRFPTTCQLTAAQVVPELEGAHANGFAFASICLPPRNRFPRLSRDEAPDGRQPPLRAGPLSTRICPITGQPSLLPSSQSRTPISSPRGSPAPGAGIRGSHVPRIYPRSRRSRLYTGGATSAMAYVRPTILGHVPFWSKPLSTIWLVLNNGACSDSHLLTL